MFNRTKVCNRLKLVPVLFWLALQMIMSGGGLASANADTEVFPFKDVFICSSINFNNTSLGKNTKNNNKDVGIDLPCKWCTSFTKIEFSCFYLMSDVCGPQRNSTVKWFQYQNFVLSNYFNSFFSIRAPPFDSKLNMSVLYI